MPPFAEPGTRLPPAFYQQTDVVAVARQLIGQLLCTRDAEGRLTTGKIVETEAYNGIHDRACHAFKHRRTPRTEILYAPGGVTYVYLCYGIHRLLNLVTDTENVPTCVLIRAIEPESGMEWMLERRTLQQPGPRLTAGPGMLTQALGIDLSFNGADLQGQRIWVEATRFTATDDDLIASPRVGIGYAGNDALLPWRFRLRGNPYTSPAK